MRRTERRGVPRAAAGCGVAAMNFLVAPVGPAATLITTQARAFPNGARASRVRRFWGFIYRWRAFIRVMWPRALRRPGLRP